MLRRQLLLRLGREIATIIVGTIIRLETLVCVDGGWLFFARQGKVTMIMASAERNSAEQRIMAAIISALLHVFAKELAQKLFVEDTRCRQ